MKITGYPALASTSTDDLVPIVDVDDTSQAATGTNKKITVTDLLAGAGGGVVLDSTAADIQPVGATAEAGSTGEGADAGHIHQGFTVLAATAIAGVAKANGTPTIITWTAPSDGKMHRVLITCVQHVSSAETGGAISANWSAPDGTAGTAGSLFAGGAGAGNVKAAAEQYLVGPGTTVSVVQSSALTAGASTIWAEIDGF